MYQQACGSQEYRQQDVMGASPIRLVIMAYDFAINACDAKDFEKAARAISVLRDALDFDYPEVATGLFRLYQYSLDNLRAGNFEGARSILVELRDAWSGAEKNVTARTLPNRAYTQSVERAAA